MNNQSAIETVKIVYDALNTNDVQSAFHFFDPEMVLVEPNGFEGAGISRGIDAVKARFESAQLGLSANSLAKF